MVHSLSQKYSLNTIDQTHIVRRVKEPCFWVKKGTGIKNSEGEPAENGDRISAWEQEPITGEAADRTRKLEMADEADQPVYNAAYDAVNFEGSRHLDFSTNITDAEDGDFTWAIRVLFNELEEGVNTLLGGSTTNYFELTNASKFKLKITGSGNEQWEDTEEPLSGSRWYSIMLVRCANQIKIYIDDGGTDFTNSDYDSDEEVEENDDVAVSTVGTRTGGINELNGQVREIIKWCDCLTADERTIIFSYLNTV